MPHLDQPIPRPTVISVVLSQRIVSAVLVLGAFLLIPLGPSYYVHLAILVLIFGLLAASLNLLMGYTGLTSFGHAAYFGVAAYTVGVLLVRLHQGFWEAAVGAALAALLLGVIFGALAVGTSGVYFLLITLALGQIIWGVAYRLTSITGGDNGLPSIPRPPISAIWPLTDVRGYYLFALLITIAALLLVALIVASPVGHILRGIRENESRMRTLGYNVWAYKYAAFILSAGFAGLAGILYAFYNGYVSPQDLHISVSAQTVLMVIVGGSGSQSGPLLGAALLVLLQNLLSSITRRWMLVLGILYILVVLYAPEGLMGLLTHLRRDPARSQVSPGA